DNQARLTTGLKEHTCRDLISYPSYFGRQLPIARPADVARIMSLRLNRIMAPAPAVSRPFTFWMA
ncbi:hypothetical protein M0R72_20065, partial [Candidatus Pacearchaeota archaeon]|nr:hypothetical protein [Candidatus Pacearchaeota archaeon]